MSGLLYPAELSWNCNGLLFGGGEWIQTTVGPLRKRLPIHSATPLKAETPARREPPGFHKRVFGFSYTFTPVLPLMDIELDELLKRIFILYG